MHGDKRLANSCVAMEAGCAASFLEVIFAVGRIVDKDTFKAA